MSELLGGMDCPKNVSWDFHWLMGKVYKEEEERAKANPELFGFLPAYIRFIMDDDGSIGRENYADWLNNRKVVK